MIDTVLSFIAPHHCSGCPETGTLLCENCKYDIISEPFLTCVACDKSIAGKQGLCGKCVLPYKRAWCVAPRHDTLQRLVDDYKFANVRAAHRPLADLLNDYLPDLPAPVRVVPIPTVSSHIRQRGYDHMLLIARRLAKRRGLRVSTDLQRATKTMQRGTNARQRTKQAKEAFIYKGTIEPDAIYLLIDDVMTTGATMKFAAKTLIDAGAQTVWVATISRQGLD